MIHGPGVRRPQDFIYVNQFWNFGTWIQHRCAQVIEVAVRMLVTLDSEWLWRRYSGSVPSCTDHIWASRHWHILGTFESPEVPAFVVKLCSFVSCQCHCRLLVLVHGQYFSFWVERLVPWPQMLGNRGELIWGKFQTDCFSGQSFSRVLIWLLRRQRFFTSVHVVFLDCPFLECDYFDTESAVSLSVTSLLTIVHTAQAW